MAGNPAYTRGGTAASFNASLSTMWARRNFPRLGTFFEAAAQLGFRQVELNHQVNSAMLEGLRLEQLPISSIHEPCPADIPTEQLKERDWLISSPSEECRGQGVAAIKRSIDLAHRLQVPVIVVHCGMMSLETGRETRLRELLKDGAQGSEQYRSTQAQLLQARSDLAGPHIDAVIRSLHELLDYAAEARVQLGLENRYHCLDIPSLDEMGTLLDLADPTRLGFVYDVGHAQALDRLGFHAHEEWLRRYSSRIIEVHLHDVLGTDDHLAPGLGEVDFDVVAAYLPRTAIRTLELQGSNTSSQVSAGLRYLAQHRCIEAL